MASPSQIVTPFSTINQVEMKDVTPGQAGIRTPQVLALASTHPSEGGQLPCQALHLGVSSLAGVCKALAAFKLRLLAR